MTSNQIAFAKLQEEIQHNRLTEAQARRELEEAKRHSVVSEVEAGRHNTAAEMETQRHDIITEAETQRSNKEQERLKGEAQAETARSNRMNERLKQESVWTEQDKLKETIRHDTAGEEEINRHNLIVEQTIPVEVKKLGAETDLTRAKIPGALADATYTNVNSDYTVAKTTGQNIENKYAPAKNVSEIGKNWSNVWYNIIRGVGTGVNSFLPGFSLLSE